MHWTGLCPFLWMDWQMTQSKWMMNPSERKSLTGMCHNLILYGWSAESHWQMRDCWHQQYMMPKCQQSHKFIQGLLSVIASFCTAKAYRKFEFIIVSLTAAIRDVSLLLKATISAPSLNLNALAREPPINPRPIMPIFNIYQNFLPNYEITR